MDLFLGIEWSNDLDVDMLGECGGQTDGSWGDGMSLRDDDFFTSPAINDEDFLMLDDAEFMEGSVGGQDFVASVSPELVSSIESQGSSIETRELASSIESQEMASSMENQEEVDIPLAVPDVLSANDSAVPVLAVPNTVPSNAIMMRQVSSVSTTEDDESAEFEHLAMLESLCDPPPQEAPHPHSLLFPSPIQVTSYSEVFPGMQNFGFPLNQHHHIPMPSPSPTPTSPKEVVVRIERRRERNRVLAKRSRLKKKNMFERLQEEFEELQRQNARLKNIAAKMRQPQPPVPVTLPPMNEEMMMSNDLVNKIKKSQHAFLITDPCLPDNPIVFASEDFLKLTGYTRQNVIGRNCRFLQGADTCPTKIDDLRRAIEKGLDWQGIVLNYKADKTPFWNRLFVAALRNADNEIVNFIGVSVEVTSPDTADPEFALASQRQQTVVRS